MWDKVSLLCLTSDDQETRLQIAPLKTRQTKTVASHQTVNVTWKRLSIPKNAYKTEVLGGIHKNGQTRLLAKRSSYSLSQQNSLTHNLK